MQKNGNILKKRGFTLVELIVTIAIFAVIAAILVPTLLGFTKSARITSANRTASELKKSIAYFLTKPTLTVKTICVYRKGAVRYLPLRLRAECGQ